MKINCIANIEINKELLPHSEFHSPYLSYLKLTKAQSESIGYYKKKIENGDIQYESVSCLCENNIFDSIASVDRYSIPQKTVMCNNCGLIQSNPRMTQEQYDKFYASDVYRECYQPDMEDFLRSYMTNEGKKINAQLIFDKINKVKPVGSNYSVLDFGAGGGRNLIPFTQCGAKAVGIEQSQSLVALGQKHGINLIQGGIDNIEGEFDVIILNHVLEHLLNPVEALKKISLHLKENGIFYIAVPNMMNFSMGQIQNAHVYYFTPDTLEYYCSKSGLASLEKGESDNFHMFSIFKKSQFPSSLSQLRQNDNAKLRAHFKKIKAKYYLKLILSFFHLEKITRNTYRWFFPYKQSASKC